MLRANELRKGQDQIQFSLAVLESARLQPRPMRTYQNFRVAARAIRPNEINLSGSQLLLGAVTALGSAGLFLWALIRLWLFGA
jgi:hypothetical protein